MVVVICGAAVKAFEADEKSTTEYHTALAQGQVLPSTNLKVAFPATFIYRNRRYKTTVFKSGPHSYAVTTASRRARVNIEVLSDRKVLLLLGRVTYNVHWHSDPSGTVVSISGQACVLEHEVDPTQLLASSPGKLVKFVVQSGEHVHPGQTIAQLEVMKMYIPLVAQTGGTIKSLKKAGIAVEAGEIVGTLIPDNTTDPGQIVQDFVGELPGFQSPEVIGDHPWRRLSHALTTLARVMDGYDNRDIEAEASNVLHELLRNPQVPYDEWQSHCSLLQAHVTLKCYQSLAGIVTQARTEGREFPSTLLLGTLHSWMDDNDLIDREARLSSLAPLTQMLRRYEHGLRNYEYQSKLDLLEQYWSTERHFSGFDNEQHQAVLELKDARRPDWESIGQIVLSHANCSAKNVLVVEILETCGSSLSGNEEGFSSRTALEKLIQKLARLKSQSTAEVRMKARQLLLAHSAVALTTPLSKTNDTASEPSDIALQLELTRLGQFNIRPIASGDKHVHVYEARGKVVQQERRLFARAIIGPATFSDTDADSSASSYNELAQVISHVLDHLEAINAEGCYGNHIFLTSQTSALRHAFEESILSDMCAQSSARLASLRVTEIELKVLVRDHSKERNSPWRYVMTNVDGHLIQTHVYSEVETDVEGQPPYFHCRYPERAGPLHGLSVMTVYPTATALDMKRWKAQAMSTQYAYDFPSLFREAVRVSWSGSATEHEGQQLPQPTGDECLVYEELVLDDQKTKVVPSSRRNGANTIGMVGWILTVKTPECPNGRQAILIANDITFKSGSFGPQEENFFLRCSELARMLGLPRIYVSANSGARVSAAEEVLPYYSVAWNDPHNAEAGFKYLYLTSETKARMEEAGLCDTITEQMTDEGEVRHRITTILGSEKSRGIECLRGSGEISAETIRAYESIFTLTHVSGRSVGIGAYLARLGQRVIQNDGAPLVLTGAQALNSVLGQTIYESNNQVGGTQIMCKNGTTHLTAVNDFDAVQKMVHWLSLTPSQAGLYLPRFPTSDTWDRDIEYYPPLKESYDARFLIEGMSDSEGHRSGMFDKGSFTETLAEWGRGVIVGRARLGGIAMGVVAVENRPVEKVIRADPGSSVSIEQTISQAGSVWYPDSAFKMAQALSDFNNGEQLPTMILANWRGFSGGQKDMTDEILKFGSFIVDSLVKYNQPVFIYCSPHGEIRGGAWVIVDMALNSAYMETYADEDARGNVLEPEALVKIKYRKDKQLEAMARLDRTCRDIRQKLSKTSSLSDPEINELNSRLAAREKLLMPVYGQIALQLAILQDTPTRLETIGVIRQQLKWINARRFFYWRLRRRLHEESLIKKMQSATRATSGLRGDRRALLSVLQRWSTVTDYDQADREVVTWFESHAEVLQAKIDALKVEGVTNTINEMLVSAGDKSLEGLANSIRTLPEEARQKLLGLMSEEGIGRC